MNRMPQNRPRGTLSSAEAGLSAAARSKVRPIPYSPNGKPGREGNHGIFLPCSVKTTSGARLSREADSEDDAARLYGHRNERGAQGGTRRQRQTTSGSSALKPKTRRRRRAQREQSMPRSLELSAPMLP